MLKHRNIDKILALTMTDLCRCLAICRRAWVWIRWWILRKRRWDGCTGRDWCYPARIWPVRDGRPTSWCSSTPPDWDCWPKCSSPTQLSPITPDRIKCQTYQFFWPKTVQFWPKEPKFLLILTEKNKNLTNFNPEFWPKIDFFELLTPKYWHILN